MIKRILILALLIPASLMLSYRPANAVITRNPFRDIVAQSALLAEADSGQILFEHNMRASHPADALARIMTLLLVVSAIENNEAHIEELIEMTDTAWEGLTSNNTTLNIRPGEEMTLKDLMYCAFVGSAAEAGNMLAERVAGSVEAFVELMNRRAIELGCENTRFFNTHGSHNSSQITTARDQFFILREALGNPIFAEISGVFRYSTESTNMSDTRRITGTNSLLNSAGKYYFRYCTSGMASVTFEGGHSFAGAAEADGLSLIVVILGSDEVINEDESVDMRNLTEARRLLEWGFSEFSWRTVISTTDLVEKAPILHGAGADFVNLRPETEIVLLLENSVPLEEFIRAITIYSVQKNEPLVAPIEAGEVLGEMSLIRNNIEYGPILLVANTSIELHRFEFIRMQVMDILNTPAARYIMWGLGLLLLAYIGLVIRYNIIRSRKVRKISEAKRKLAEERMQASKPDEELLTYREDQRRRDYSETVSGRPPQRPPQRPGGKQDPRKRS